MNFIKEYKYYHICFLLFLIIGGILLMTINQGDVLLYFNANRSPAANFFFKYFTKVGEEYGYIIVVTFFLFKRFRFALLAFLSGVGALLLSYLLKSYFRHPRPIRYFHEIGTWDQIEVVDGVHLLSGTLSFPSGHTASGFALYSIVAFLVGKKWYWQVALFLVALLVGLSRIYLVQHFLKDVYLGAITGVFIAIFIYLIQQRFPYNDKRWIDRSLLYKKSSPQA